MTVEPPADSAPDTADALADRVAAVRARVMAACRSVGRDPASVALLAATKTRTPAEIALAVRAGIRLVGENRAQELRDKHEAVAALLAPEPAPEWHFIGALQRNKVKYVVGRATLVHAVDSLKLGEELSAQALEAGTPIGVLVEVNTGGEASKAGVVPEAALDLAQALHALPGLRLRGLMTIPPDVPEPRPFFERLAALGEEGRQRGLPLSELSMGMSGDLEAAIACGATIVRVGTALFGPRRPRAATEG